MVGTVGVHGMGVPRMVSVSRGCPKGGFPCVPKDCWVGFQETGKEADEGSLLM